MLKTILVTLDRWGHAHHWVRCPTRSRRRLGTQCGEPVDDFVHSKPVMRVASKADLVCPCCHDALMAALSQPQEVYPRLFYGSR